MERMDDFFTARVDGYDEHMLTNVEGCKEAYVEMAKLLPQNCNTLLDLGCGTGLELDEIFKMCDRTGVLCDGEMMGIRKISETDFNEIGKMMSGEKGEEADA